MSKVDTKVDLTLMRSLMAELESYLAHAESLEGNKESNNEAILDLSKAYGITATLVQEATFVAGDIRKAVRIKSAGTVPVATGKDLAGLSDEDLMTAIFGPIKGSDDSKN